MVNDPGAPPSLRVRLFPVGLERGVKEPNVDEPTEPDKLYIDGHIIHDEFVEMYNALGSTHIVGRPLTEVRFNLEAGRMEQYFENLGFYRLEADPNNADRLLSYGAFMCDRRCHYTPNEVALPAIPAA